VGPTVRVVFDSVCCDIRAVSSALVSTEMAKNSPGSSSILPCPWGGGLRLRGGGGGGKKPPPTACRATLIPKSSHHPPPLRILRKRRRRHGNCFPSSLKAQARVSGLPWGTTVIIVALAGGRSLWCCPNFSPAPTIATEPHFVVAWGLHRITTGKIAPIEFAVISTTD
jgi:hypothetical protein